MSGWRSDTHPGETARPCSSPRQRSGAACSCREGGSAFRLARKSESARSVAAVTEGRSGAEDLRSRLTAATDRALPDAGNRPALISLAAERPGKGRIDGGSEPARRRAAVSVRGRGGGARAEPPRQHTPCSTWSMLAHDSYRVMSQSSLCSDLRPSISSSVLGRQRTSPGITWAIFEGPPRHSCNCLYDSDLRG